MFSQSPFWRQTSCKGNLKGTCYSIENHHYHKVPSSYWSFFLNLCSWCQIERFWKSFDHSSGHSIARRNVTSSLTLSAQTLFSPFPIGISTKHLSANQNNGVWNIYGRSHAVHLMGLSLGGFSLQEKLLATIWYKISSSEKCFSIILHV